MVVSPGFGFVTSVLAASFAGKSISKMTLNSFNTLLISKAVILFVHVVGYTWIHLLAFVAGGGL